MTGNSEPLKVVLQVTPQGAVTSGGSVWPWSDLDTPHLSAPEEDAPLLPRVGSGALPSAHSGWKIKIDPVYFFFSALVSCFPDASRVNDAALDTGDGLEQSAGVWARLREQCALDIPRTQHVKVGTWAKLDGEEVAGLLESFEAEILRFCRNAAAAALTSPHSITAPPPQDVSAVRGRRSAPLFNTIVSSLFKPAAARSLEEMLDNIATSCANIARIMVQQSTLALPVMLLTEYYRARESDPSLVVAEWRSVDGAIRDGLEVQMLANSDTLQFRLSKKLQIISVTPSPDVAAVHLLTDILVNVDLQRVLAAEFDGSAKEHHWLAWDSPPVHVHLCWSHAALLGDNQSTPVQQPGAPSMPWRISSEVAIAVRHWASYLSRRLPL